MTRRSYGARLCDASVQSSHHVPIPMPMAGTDGRGRRNRNRIPRNLLDDLTDESSALAQVTLGLGRLWLDDAGLGFLYCAKKGWVSHVLDGPSPSARWQ
jgi:hypothetical protein